MARCDLELRFVAVLIFVRPCVELSWGRVYHNCKVYGRLRNTVGKELYPRNNDGISAETIYGGG